MIGIYKITSPTGRIYIGQSRDILNRKSSYKNLSCKKQPKIYQSLIKHGWESHLFEVIHELPKEVTQETLNTYEILYWDQYLACGFKMMNIRKPGSNGKFSKESVTKRESSRQFNGKAKRSEETRLKIGAANKGKKKPTRSLEHRKNLSRANKGKVGVKQSEEIKEKRKQTREGRNSCMKKILHIASNTVYSSRKEAAIAFNWTAENINYYIKKGTFKYL